MSTELNERIPGVNELPAGWKVVPIKFLFSFGKGLSITKADLQDDGINVISYGQIHAKWNTGVHLHSELIRHVNSAFADENPYALVPVNGFIFADTSEDLAGSGNCAYVDEDIPVYAGYHTITLKSKTGTSNKYLAYLFQTDAWRYQIRKDLTRVKVYSISQQKLRTTYALVPPANIQASVVSFLDEHCEAIDSAISKHQQIIEKLEEYRKAVITQAVTKGLNLNVEMKDSGNMIIGAIPTHWKYERIKYLFTIRKRIAGEEGYTVLSITQHGIVPKDIDSNKGQIAADYSDYQLVYAGDFAMNHMDLLTGWVDISNYDGVTSPDYRVFTINDETRNDKRYFKYLLQMCYFNRIFYRLGAGISGMGRWRLQAPAFNNFKFPVPPLAEQAEIANYIDHVSETIDTAVSQHNQLISKLQEYKQSLIYNAVTGKIDCTVEAKA